MNKNLLIVIGIIIVVGAAFAFTRTKAPAPDGGLAHPDIRPSSPVPGMLVASPLSVTGEARGIWYFEASFPMAILDADRNEIAQSHAEAQGEWMTEDFVPFAGTIEFIAPASDTGFLVLKKDNPSGLPEYDDSIEIPVRFR